MAELVGLTTEETDKEFVVRGELPGFEPTEVKVEVVGERLAITAQRAEPVEKPVATYRNGVLEVHFPHAPEAVGRQIEVKT